MTTLTLEAIDETLTARLRLSAARHKRSLEEEALAILHKALAVESDSGQSLVASIRTKVEPFGGVELDIPPREAIRQPPTFDE